MIAGIKHYPTKKVSLDEFFDIPEQEKQTGEAPYRFVVVRPFPPYSKAEIESLNAEGIKINKDRQHIPHLSHLNEDSSVCIPPTVLILSPKKLNHSHAILHRPLAVKSRKKYRRRKKKAARRCLTALDF